MHIGILGGGIAGLSCAIALKQKGFSTAIYERAEQPKDIGAGIVCWPNASFVLNELGVLDEVSNHAGSVVSMQRFNDQGEALGALDVTELNRLMNFPSYSILRTDLLRILTTRALQLNIPIHYQHSVTTLEENNAEVTVHFKNGSSIKPDLILGAEGRMNSLARSFVNGDNTPIYQGFVNWVGVINSDRVHFPQFAVNDYWGVGKRFGIVPISKNKAYWAGGALMEKSIDTPPPNYHCELHDLFDTWPDPIKSIINETPASRIHKIYVHDHNPISVWHKHNVLLVGDAAHAPLPTSGQGACQALEDAWHIAHCLSETPNDYAAAYKNFTPRKNSRHYHGRASACVINFQSR